jgi:hypothetical protein
MVRGESVAVQHAARESVIAAPWPTILGWTLASCAAPIDASYRALRGRSPELILTSAPKTNRTSWF